MPPSVPPSNPASRPALTGGLLALGAAALFGATTPLSKLLLPGVGPLALAALLYLGAGLGLAAYRLASGRGRVVREARLRRSDLPAILGVVLLGGVAGPVLMLAGLARLSGVSSALLLNLEAPLTLVVAAALFREHVGRREIASMALVVAGAVIVAGPGGGPGRDAAGALAVAGACLAWAADNNLTQSLSLRDPVALMQVKGLGAGGCTLAVALATGQSLPGPWVTAASLALGALGYGASLVLSARAFRLLGAARQALYFATAPFLGALLAVPLLGERPGPGHAAAGVLMCAGVALLLRERHAHLHEHAALDHDHAHVHDEHHTHAHDGPVSEPHAHPHRHAPLVHDHAHLPDAHHRHRHGE